jgi:hypothetical protein
MLVYDIFHLFAEFTWSKAPGQAKAPSMIPAFGFPKASIIWKIWYCKAGFVIPKTIDIKVVWHFGLKVGKAATAVAAAGSLHSGSEFVNFGIKSN